MSRRTLHRRSLGLCPYGEALALMDGAVEARLAGGADTVLVVRHPPVITVGRKRGSELHVRDAEGLPVVPVPRGGDVTFHGEGQIVLYPIVALEGPDRDLHRFMRDLEEACIRALAGWGVSGRRDEGRTGVWVGARKIASVGIAVRRWVTYHGISLNVFAEPRFRTIVPCGLDGVVMTSMEEESGRAPGMAEVADALVAAFAAVRGYEIVVPAGEDTCVG